MNFRPIHVGCCPCGKKRGHEGECNDDIFTDVVIDLRGLFSQTPWHDMRDHLVETFGQEIGNFLAKRIGSSIRGKGDCIDRFSVVELPSRFWHHWMPSFKKSLARHQYIRQEGCCGSFDTTITHYRTGRRFAWGFNYGH